MCVLFVPVPTNHKLSIKYLLGIALFPQKTVSLRAQSVAVATGVERRHFDYAQWPLLVERNHFDFAQWPLLTDRCSLSVVETRQRLYTYNNLKSAYICPISISLCLKPIPAYPKSKRI